MISDFLFSITFVIPDPELLNSTENLYVQFSNQQRREHRAEINQWSLWGYLADTVL